MDAGLVASPGSTSPRAGVLPAWFRYWLSAPDPCGVAATRGGPYPGLLVADLARGRVRDPDQVRKQPWVLDAQLVGQRQRRLVLRVQHGLDRAAVAVWLDWRMNRYALVGACSLACTDRRGVLALSPATGFALSCGVVRN
jgi:hypothetical protein